MGKEIKYNLPGYGFASCLLFSVAEQYMSLFEENGLIEKSKNVAQLGVMKYVYPGAHHTRYEYIFTQLMLISNITKSKGTIQRNVELSLGSELLELKSNGIFGRNVKVSGGDIMQILALLSNLGHMYDTFTASKMLIKQLQNSRAQKSDFYKTYKRNLPKSIYDKFEEMLNTSNYYKLHLYNMIHLIQGMSHKEENKPKCQYAIKLLTLLIDDSLIQNEATKRIFFLYKKIRKIAYLSVDMIYTPASFGVNLNRMIDTVSIYVDELFNEDSVINNTLAQLEDIIHKQIYDSPVCILNTARIEYEYEKNYETAVADVKSIYDIRDILLEKEYPDLRSKKQPICMSKMIDKSELILSGKACELTDILKYDEYVNGSIPASRILFGTQVSQDLKKIYSSFALISSKRICQDVQLIISKCITGRLYAESEKIDLIKYAVKSLYRYNDFFFNLSAPSGIELNECVFIGNGCKTVAKRIKEKFSAKNVSDPDQMHEISSCVKVLESISYSGAVMCFVGGIKASEYNKTKKLDELDGLIYFPAKVCGETFAIIIEAKNYPNGEHDAEKQLKDTEGYLSEEINSNIVVMTRCSYMELKLKV